MWNLHEHDIKVVESAGINISGLVSDREELVRTEGKVPDAKNGPCLTRPVPAHVDNRLRQHHHGYHTSCLMA